MRAAKEHTMRADIVPGGIFPDYELTARSEKLKFLSPDGQWFHFYGTRRSRPWSTSSP
jgi:hypothetical protein